VRRLPWTPDLGGLRLAGAFVTEASNSAKKGWILAQKASVLNAFSTLPSFVFNNIPALLVAF